MKYYTPTYIKNKMNAIKRVRELHKPVEIGTDYGDNYGDLGCPICNELYPCLTIKALDGN